MRKSFLKQTTLAILAGPPGLCYVSVNAALLLTFCTLILILLFEDNGLYLLLGSFPVAVALGLTLVHNHNRKTGIRDFTVSSYMGTVSYKVVSKNPVKRSYHKSLYRARIKKKIAYHQTTVLAVLCIIIISFITVPDLITRLSIYQQQSMHTHAASTDNHDLVPNDNVTAELSDVGQWIIDTNTKNKISASLKANNYQKSSNNIAYRPKLTLSCIENTTTLIFETAETLGTEKTTIILSFANGRRIQKPWEITADYQSALAPNPIQSAKAFSVNPNVKVLFKPFKGTTQKTARFNLDNSRKVFKKIAKRCSW